jgi:hypothetical protein
LKKKQKKNVAGLPRQAYAPRARAPVLVTRDYLLVEVGRRTLSLFKHKVSFKKEKYPAIFF